MVADDERGVDPGFIGVNRPAVKEAAARVAASRTWRATGQGPMRATGRRTRLVGAAWIGYA
jgi:hypothetical protein